MTLYEVALGLRPPTRGTVSVGGQPIGRPTPRAMLGAGVVGVPEDPVADAVVPGLTVAEHVALDDLPGVRRRLGIDWAKVAGRLTDVDAVVGREVRRGQVLALDREFVSLVNEGFSRYFEAEVTYVNTPRIPRVGSTRGERQREGYSRPERIVVLRRR